MMAHYISEVDVISALKRALREKKEKEL